MIGRLDWTITVDGEIVDPDSPAHTSLLEAAATEYGLAESVRLIALQLQVAGDCWYLYDGQQWKIVATTSPTLRQITEEYAKTEKPTIRAHQCDPENPERADSAVRAALDPAEDLILLASLSRAQSRSRLSQAGILIVPDGVLNNDVFYREMQDMMAAAIIDERSPSAVVPLQLKYPKEHIQDIRHLVLERPYDDQLEQKIRTAQHRIALALDVPTELLEGSAALNHWTAWLIDEQNWTMHAAPLAELIGEVLARAVEQVFGYESGKVRIEPDPTVLLARRSSVEDALRAAAIGAVSLKYVRRTIGATEDDAPTVDDLETVRTLRDRRDETTPPQTSRGLPSLSASAVSASAVSGPDQLDDATMWAEHTVLGRFGARIRSLAASEPDVAARIDGVPNHLVAATLGKTTVEAVVGDVSAATLDAHKPYWDWCNTQGMRPRTFQLLPSGSPEGIVDLDVLSVQLAELDRNLLETAVERLRKLKPAGVNRYVDWFTKTALKTKNEAFRLVGADPVHESDPPLVASAEWLRLRLTEHYADTLTADKAPPVWMVRDAIELAGQ